MIAEKQNRCYPAPNSPPPSRERNLGGKVESARNFLPRESAQPLEKAYFRQGNPSKSACFKIFTAPLRRQPALSVLPLEEVAMRAALSPDLEPGADARGAMFGNRSSSGHLPGLSATKAMCAVRPGWMRTVSRQ